MHPEITSREILIREDTHGKIFLTGAREVVVRSYEDAIACLEEGCLNRTTAGTLMNEGSSRSHSVFTLSVDVLDINQAKEVRAKLHLVDLAGSERAKRTGASGARLKESVGINQGLMTLGKVIRALTQHQGTTDKLTHIPYRESKLTRLLQDSLGGNSRTVMIACISPAVQDHNETLLTLQYATRTKAVQNRVTANVVSVPLVFEDYDPNSAAAETTEAVVKALQTELRDAQEELRRFRTSSHIQSPKKYADPSIRQHSAQKLVYLQTELITIRRQLDAFEIDSATLDEVRDQLTDVKTKLSAVLSNADSYGLSISAQFHQANLRASQEAKGSLENALLRTPSLALSIEELMSAHRTEIETLKAHGTIVLSVQNEPSTVVEQ